MWGYGSKAVQALLDTCVNLTPIEAVIVQGYLDEMARDEQRDEEENHQAEAEYRVSCAEDGDWSGADEGDYENSRIYGRR